MRISVILLLVVSAFATASAGAQSAQANPSGPQQVAQPATPADSQPQTNTKKVWTNEDLRDLPANAVVSSSTSKHTKPVPVASTPLRNGDVQRYQNQISRLKAQASALEPQIAALQAAIEGKQVDEPRKYGWQRPASYPDELAELQAKRGSLLDKISALEDEARHKGVPPGELP